MIESIEIKRQLDAKSDHEKTIKLLEREQDRYSNSKGQCAHKITITNKANQKAIVIKTEGASFTRDLMEKLKGAGLYLTHSADDQATEFHMAAKLAGQMFRAGMQVNEPGASIFSDALFPAQIPPGGRLALQRLNRGGGTARILQIGAWIAENARYPTADDLEGYQEAKSELESEIATSLDNDHPELGIQRARVTGEHDSEELRVQIDFGPGYKFDGDFIRASAVTSEAL